MPQAILDISDLFDRIIVSSKQASLLALVILLIDSLS